MTAKKHAIVVIGKNGQLAHSFANQFAGLSQADFDFTFLSPSDPDNYIDLANTESIQQAFARRAVDTIINTAAYTAVDKAESEADRAMAINGIAPGVLAEIAAQKNALLIHYSTDYVFDGSKRSPYVETDIPAPLNVYGQTKLAGEQAIQNKAARYLIFRTSWVYSMHGQNFLLTMLRLAQERDALSIVCDQQGAPTWSEMLAANTLQILLAMLDNHDRQQQVSGLYHLTSQGVTNWHDFAAEIFRLKNISCKLKAIPTTAYPTPAQRPLYSVLDGEKFRTTFGIKVADWRDSLVQCINGSS